MFKAGENNYVKNRMKKLVSVLLALTMTVLCFVPAAAAEPKDKVTPILIIAGFSEYTLVDGDGNQVWGRRRTQ